MQNRYPLWKNLVLVGLAVIAFVYALPNFYTEEPVVQISSQNPMDTSLLKQQVQSVLEKSHIPYTKLTANPERLEVRFSSTDIQLHARDVITKELNADYTVALNLLPSTPNWLASIGAEPMKQGLDLRGGVHFLLEVDIDSVINRRYEGLMKTTGQLLREAGVRYSKLKLTPKMGIEVGFKTQVDRNKALELLKEKSPALIYDTTKDEQAIVVSLSVPELETIRQNTIEQTMTILRKRVNELGVAEAVVQQQGATRVAVDLPGIQDAARAHQILGGTATLQFHLVDAENDAMVAKQTGVVPMNSKLYSMNGYPILLKRQVVLSGDSITSATSSFDQETAGPSVSIQLGGGGEAFFTKTTRENVGKRLAIVYVESKTALKTIGDTVQRTIHHEERVISAPVINSALGHSFQITGITDTKEATNLALLLRAGALPTVIYPIEERTVGPSLGKENIHRGVVSLEVGMGLILLIMLVYYRFFGVVANVALFLNLIFLCALLSILGATLTLPGIAGMVLTVGMAVDANVLIYERIREELRLGVSVQAAIYAGYERAFATILDANITTFIVAVVLFSIGTGPVRGFAVTLSLGLLTSMITGVTFTRAIVNAVYGRRKNIKKISIGI
jgi:preprotein translocase subunit SecD